MVLLSFQEGEKVVQIRMCASSAHALYFHCTCHRLQLASIQAAESNSEIKNLALMSNVWKLFYYSPKKAETLLQCFFSCSW